jgi:hypothetical protein
MPRTLLHAVAGANADTGMDAEACNRRAAPTRRQGVRVYHRITRFRGAPTGPRARGYAPQNRSAVEFGKQRLVASQGVLVGIGPQPQAAMFQDMRDPPANAVHDPCNFGITRRPTPFSMQP